MKHFHSAATWVVFQWRCSSALCFLLLPLSDPKQRIGHQTHQQQKQQQQQSFHYWPSSISHTSSNQRKAPMSSPLPTRHRVLWQSIEQGNSSENDELGQVKREEDDYEASKLNRLGTLRKNVQGRVAQVFQNLIQSSKSLLLSIRSREKITDMEEAFDMRNYSSSGDSPSDFNTMTTTISKDDSFDESMVDFECPNGPRWAIASPETNFSGTWRPIVTQEFKSEYEKYLEACGTGRLFRKVCLGFAGSIREQIDQVGQGRILHFKATSPAGIFNRSLFSSGTDVGIDDYEVEFSEFLDPDKEPVKVEAWWEDEGTVHRSFMREKPGVFGGEFESKRYLMSEGDDVVLVCESTFHPSPTDLKNPSSRFKPGFVRWKYRKISQ